MPCSESFLLLFSDSNCTPTAAQTPLANSKDFDRQLGPKAYFQDQDYKNLTMEKIIICLTDFDLHLCYRAMKFKIR